jgi:predicted permease
MAWPGIVARLRALWRDLAHRGADDAEMLEEFRHHIALRTRDLIREGLTPAEAERRARVEFGHVDGHRADARDARGLRLFDEFRFSTLDLILGLRMIRKHPGLSVVSVLGLALAIAIAAGGFGLIEVLLDPRLPLPDGDRIVSLQNEEVGRPGIARRRSAWDVAQWRDQLRSVEHVGAFMGEQRNVAVPGGGVELVRIARIHAAGFRAAGVPPILGRPLVDHDERIGAPPVVVIAEEEWRRRFEADRQVVGRTVVIGDEPHTVVGVMPAGFRFPVFFRYWVPLRLDPSLAPGAGPALEAFGRLAPGTTRAGAQAELATIGARRAAAQPATHGALRPRLMPYTRAFMDLDTPAVARALRLTQLAVALVLIVVAANVAVLVYARTANRAGEIAVRTALGAPRRRIVAQLFAEALVLTGTAAVLGLWLAGAGSRALVWVLERPGGDGVPFWWRPGLSGSVIAYVVGLALLAAVIVGILPALTATGRRVQANLQRLASRGSGMALGRTWTTLIVIQVAVAVALLPFAIHVSGQALRRATMEPGYPVEQLVRARLMLEGATIRGASEAEAEDSARAAAVRFRGAAAALLRRLATETEMAGVTFARRFPGGGSMHRFEMDTPGIPAWLTENQVDTRLFAVLGIRTAAGRDFVEGDARNEGAAVIVNRAFGEELLNGRSPIGRRIRELRLNPDTREIEPGPWREIVGVIPDFAVEYAWDPTRPGLYYAEPTLYAPMPLDQAPAGLALMLRVRGPGATRFMGRLRQIAATVDPRLQLHDLTTELQFQQDARRVLFGGALAILAVTASVVLLSAAGISAMMSFTVARRRREIGIRAALGAHPGHLLRGIFSRAAWQLGAGALLGLLVAVGVDHVLRRTVGSSPLSGGGMLLVPVVAALIVAVGLLATWGPARTGLSIQPTEALREE